VQVFGGDSAFTIDPVVRMASRNTCVDRVTESFDAIVVGGGAAG